METTTRTTLSLKPNEGEACGDSSDTIDEIGKIMSDFIDESSEENVSFVIIDKTDGTIRERFTFDDIQTAQNLLEALSGRYPFEYEIQKEGDE